MIQLKVVLIGMFVAVSLGSLLTMSRDSHESVEQNEWCFYHQYDSYEAFASTKRPTWVKIEPLGERVNVYVKCAEFYRHDLY